MGLYTASGCRMAVRLSSVASSWFVSSTNYQECGRLCATALRLSTRAVWVLGTATQGSLRPLWCACSRAAKSSESQSRQNVAAFDRVEQTEHVRRVALAIRQGIGTCMTRRIKGPPSTPNNLFVFWSDRRCRPTDGTNFLGVLIAQL